MKDYSHGELAKDILKGLALGGFIVACAVVPNLPQVLKLFGVSSSRDSFRFMRTVKNLQKQKMVSVYRKGGQDVIEITVAGKRKVLSYNLDEMQLKKTKKWNGMWHIVMFDIPEFKKNARGALSRKVREFGLYPLQKSVFVSPYSCKDEIDFIGEFFGVRKHIVYIIAHEIEGAKKMERYFEVSA